MAKGRSSSLNPRTTEYEFMGPVGAFVMVTTLPLTVVALYLLCNEEYCLEFSSLSDIRLAWPSKPWLTEYGLYAVFGWFFFQVLLERTLPGKWVEGTRIRDGSRLKYKMNGFLCMVVSLSAVAALHFTGAINLARIHDELLSLIVAATLLSYLLSAYLYDRSFDSNRLLALGGNSGNAFYDFFIGRELNPRLGTFDLKSFCELRPGLIGWVVLNWGMAAKEFEATGAVSLNMVLVNAFQFYYVFDALWNEPAILTTMDITSDGFGFMLVCGDLLWVPFTYSLQARFLASYHPTLSYAGAAVIVAVKLLGLYIFRSSNSQKDAFRTNPNSAESKQLKSIPTARGTRLIVSGWWGISRHINYFGDWLMAWSWCLPTLFVSPIPYFYVAYFAILLIHRQLRDDHSCSIKYGKDWEKYCSLVPHRIIPYVY